MDATSRLKHSFGARLRTFRKQQKLSGTELARHIGCSPSWLSHVEAGRGAPTFDFLARAAEILAVDVLDLFCFPAASARHSVVDRLRLAGPRRASWIDGELAHEGWGEKPAVRGGR